MSLDGVWLEQSFSLSFVFSFFLFASFLSRTLSWGFLQTLACVFFCLWEHFLRNMLLASSQLLFFFLAHLSRLPGFKLPLQQGWSSPSSFPTPLFCVLHFKLGDIISFLPCISSSGKPSLVILALPASDSMGLFRCQKSVPSRNHFSFNFDPLFGALNFPLPDALRWLLAGFSVLLLSWIKLLHLA